MCHNDVTIRVRGLKKDFEDVSVLKGIDIDIHKGDVVCVIGASGSGKSTFLRCLNLLEQPTGGSIYFEGANLTDEKVDLNLHRQKMGMVFQQFNLFPHMTILENLTCAPVMLKNTDEILMALAICAVSDRMAKLALEQLDKLKNCEIHSTVILSHVDEKTFKSLGMHVTCEPQRCPTKV